MYNNRRNNRFSIFIAAIIVSLLVLLTGCASTKKETDLAKPVAEDSSNPVTLTVYLTAHYANPDTHCPIYEKLLDYQKENPNITIQFVSPKEGDTAEREAEIHQLNTEILSGKGPDLFIMEGNRLTNVNLFPDIEKSMMNGAFPKSNQDWKQIAKKSGNKCRQKKDIALKILFHFIHQGTI